MNPTKIAKIGVAVALVLTIGCRRTQKAEKELVGGFKIGTYESAPSAKAFILDGAGKVVVPPDISAVHNDTALIWGTLRNTDDPAFDHQPEGCFLIDTIGHEIVFGLSSAQLEDERKKRQSQH